MRDRFIAWWNKPLTWKHWVFGSPVTFVLYIVFWEYLKYLIK